VVVVDNGCTDGAVERLEPDGRVRHVAASENLGFGGGCNLGASLATGDVLAFVNPDAIAAPGALAELAAALADPSVGIAMGCIQLLQQPGMVNSAGGAIHFLGLGWATGMGQPASAFAERRDVAAASGAGMAIRRATFEALGGFTEKLFLYHEDAELSLRSWMAGLRVIFVPEARIDHDYEFSRHAQKLYFLERNRLILLLTCYQARTLLLLAPALLAFEAGITAVAFAQGWGAKKVSTWGWIATHVRWLWSQRRRLQQSRQAPDRAFMHTFSARFDAKQLPASPLVSAADRVLAGYWKAIRRFI
jgi:GT2 family glycosyltransferase